MLDDLKYIHEKDAADALGIAGKQADQLRKTYELDDLNFEAANIVFAGMGGSALAAQLSLTWPGYAIPFAICRDYDIPAYVGGSTLFIASSYSGNTEETIEALHQAEGKGARIVVISSGGKLQEIAAEKQYPFLQIPGGLQPRHAVLYGLKALVTVLEKAGLTSGGIAELEKTADFIEKSVAAWAPDVPAAKNPAKKLAQELMGKSPVVYAGPKMFPAAYKWKISFNENAKNVAWCGQFSEFNHNEFLGWISHPVDKPYGVIELRCPHEHERIQKRFGITDKLLSGKWPHPHIIEPLGDTMLEHLLWTVAFGDFVSLYLALLNGLNPTPVDLIEKLKAELNA